MRWLWTFALVLALVPACKKDPVESKAEPAGTRPAPQLPPPAPPKDPVHAQIPVSIPDAGPRPDASTDYRCKFDHQCTVSCDIPASCCGELCQCTRPYHKNELAAVRKRNKDVCALKDVQCPEADCIRPRDEYIPKCENETCIAKKVPRHWKSPEEYTCKQDSDCVVSCVKPNQRCGQLCTCNGIYHKDELADIERVNSERYSDADKKRCPVARCAKPLYRYEARCQKGRCVEKRIRR